MKQGCYDQAVVLQLLRHLGAELSLSFGEDHSLVVDVQRVLKESTRSVQMEYCGSRCFKEAQIVQVAYDIIHSGTACGMEQFNESFLIAHLLPKKLKLVHPLLRNRETIAPPPSCNLAIITLLS